VLGVSVEQGPECADVEAVAGFHEGTGLLLVEQVDESTAEVAPVEGDVCPEVTVRRPGPIPAAEGEGEGVSTPDEGVEIERHQLAPWVA
jgi:hypothetical protein